MALSTGARAQGSTMCLDDPSARTGEPTGPVLCPQVKEVLISTNLAKRCFTERCISTAIDSGRVVSPLYFDKGRFLTGDDPRTLSVDLCYANRNARKPGQTSAKDCPTGARETYLNNKDYGELPAGADWKVLTDLPKCFVLRWEDGNVSTRFAVKTNLDQVATCLR